MKQREINEQAGIGGFAAECEVVICQLSPELDYRREDLNRFVLGRWPTDDAPADVACDFVNSLD